MTTELPEFKAWDKIYRLNREWICSEKIDGTNGLVYIPDDRSTVLAGSRSKWIFPGKQDNAGFAGWVEAHKEELLDGLGPGYHYGEFWGQGIQRRYGLNEKRFSLFNVSRWTDDVRPKCCHVVPTLARGTDIRLVTELGLDILRLTGSVAAPGFDKPEGVVIYHTASGHLYKVTLENDAAPKGAQEKS